MVWNIEKKFGTAADSTELSQQTNFQFILRGRVFIAADFAWNGPNASAFCTLTEQYSPFVQTVQ